MYNENLIDMLVYNWEHRIGDVEWREERGAIVEVRNMQHLKFGENRFDVRSSGQPSIVLILDVEKNGEVNFEFELTNSFGFYFREPIEELISFSLFSNQWERIVENKNSIYLEKGRHYLEVRGSTGFIHEIAHAILNIT
ncbi:MAG: hypothetical protein FWC11_06065 [Firmicutes bacterium]|nr:hypothetical protein [Bacillota bacterium]MCL2256397.1 hypothetical protein [Bacillota bacterium]